MSKLEEKDSLDKILENSDSTDSSPQNINEMSHAQLRKQSRSPSITNDNNEKNDAKLSKELESQMPPLQMTKTDKEYIIFLMGDLQLGWLWGQLRRSWQCHLVWSIPLVCIKRTMNRSFHPFRPIKFR